MKTMTARSSRNFPSRVAYKLIIIVLKMMKMVFPRMIPNGDGFALASPSGGTGNYTYQWDANAGNATTSLVTDLCSGPYSVTISDGQGCTTESLFEIIGPIIISTSIIVSALYYFLFHII